MRRIQVWNLGNGELSPEAIRELIPIAAGDHQGWRRHLLMSVTSHCIATSLPVILPSAVPYEEILRDRNSRGPASLAGIYHTFWQRSWSACQYAPALLRAAEDTRVHANTSAQTRTVEPSVSPPREYKGLVLLRSRYAASQGAVASFCTYSPRPTSTASWSLDTYPLM